MEGFEDFFYSVDRRCLCLVKVLRVKGRVTWRNGF